MNRIELVVLDISYWVAANFAIGYLGHRLSSNLVRRTIRFRSRTDLRERVLRLRQITKVQRWKHRLPEAGAFFAGGTNKSVLDATSAVAIEKLIIEFRRAELVHVALCYGWLVPFLFNPIPIALAMGPYVIIANLPCLISLRYGRYRLMIVDLGRLGR